MNDIDYYENNYNIFIRKCSKDKNDETNKIREKIIKIFFENYKNKNFEPKIGKNIFDNLSLLLASNNIDKIINTQHIGGLKANDFVITYMKENKEINLNIDFKFNSNKITKLSQIKQIFTTDKKITDFIKKKYYHEFYYDNYLDKILELLETKNIILKKPKYEFYLTNINKFSKKKMNEFFENLKINQKKYTKEFKEIVNKSIFDYLHNYYNNINIDILTENLQSAENKAYLLFKNNCFNLENIDSIKIKSFNSIKNNNTLVFDTCNNKKIEMLLRWKNGCGCVGSGWQIKIT
jgi:hypothetical protein